MHAKGMTVVFSTIVILLLSVAAGAAEKVNPSGHPSAPCGTFGAPGDPTLQESAGFQKSELPGPQSAGFGNDILVREKNGTSKEYYQDMASDPNGGLYVIWEDDALIHHYLQIYKSTDGGHTWSAFGHLQNKFADLKKPSIAVGAGKKNSVLIAYIVDDGTFNPTVEVATVSWLGGNFDIHQVPVDLDCERYTDPEIWTDMLGFNIWYAYLTFEGEYPGTAQGCDVFFSKSKDHGETWSTPGQVFGQSSSDRWMKPDGAFGTTQDRLFVTCYNTTDLTIHVRTSDDRGTTFDPSVAIGTLPTSPMNAPDPEIEAAVYHDNVMLCSSYIDIQGTAPDISFSQSTDAGITWSTMQDLPNSFSYLAEKNPRLTANEGGKSFHLAYSSNTLELFYTCCPQDLSSHWQSQVSTHRVDDTGDGGPCKGIASNWSTDVACIAWSDYRDGQPDYDTYFDFVGNLGLSVDKSLFKAPDGGFFRFFLNAGKNNAKRKYILLASVTGTEPGWALPGGQVVLPINYDIFTRTVLDLINTKLFDNFMGQLDTEGKAEAQFNLPPMTLIDKVPIHFAFALNNPWDYVSNPVMCIVWH